jgi:hypothetical protein
LSLLVEEVAEEEEEKEKEKDEWWESKEEEYVEEEGAFVLLHAPPHTKSGISIPEDRQDHCCRKIRCTGLSFKHILHRTKSRVRIHHQRLDGGFSLDSSPKRPVATR